MSALYEVWDGMLVALLSTLPLAIAAYLIERWR